MSTQNLDTRSGQVFNLAASASSISRKESSWGQGVTTSPAQVISGLVEAELSCLKRQNSVWSNVRKKAEKLHDTSMLEWFRSQTAELAFCCMRATENPQAGIKLDQQLDTNPVLGSILMIIIHKYLQEFDFRLFLYQHFCRKMSFFWLLHDWLWPYSACCSITAQILQDKQASTPRLMTKAAAACWFTRSEAADEIHSAGGESRGQQLNSHYYLKLLFWTGGGACWGSFAQRCPKFRVAFTADLSIYPLLVYHLYLCCIYG